MVEVNDIRRVPVRSKAGPPKGRLMYNSIGRGLALVLLWGLVGPWGAEAARIRAWGWIDEVTWPVPEGDDLVAIAAGSTHNVALREDGSVANGTPGSTTSGPCRKTMNSWPSPPGEEVSQWRSAPTGRSSGGGQCI